MSPRLEILPRHLTEPPGLRPPHVSAVAAALWRANIGGPGCWEWDGHRITGYGHTTYMGRSVLAHRLLYESLFGPLAEGLQLDHLCRNRACLRPSHLEPVTQKENIRRGWTARGKRENCLQGHPLVDGNLVLYELGRGKRKCRICRLAYVSARYYRLKARK